MNLEQLKKERRAEYRKRYYQKNPWMRHLNNSRVRAKKRDRINTLTVGQIKHLWNRDKAWKLSQPSIDRIDNNEGYFIENCRFIEHKHNSYLGRIGGNMSPETKLKLSRQKRKGRLNRHPLEKKMDANNMTITELHKVSGIGIDTISRILLSKSSPRKSTLSKLYSYL